MRALEGVNEEREVCRACVAFLEMPGDREMTMRDRGEDAAGGAARGESVARGETRGGARVRADRVRCEEREGCGESGADGG